MDVCKEHKQPGKYVCIHPDCFNFNILCDECFKDHMRKHPQNHLNSENPILDRNQIMDKTQKILNALEEELQLIQNKAANALIAQTTNNIDGIILEIESIRLQINKLFDKYIQGLKDKFMQKYRQNIHQIYTQIQAYIEQVREFQLNSNTILVQKRVNQTDLQYQVLYQKSRLDDLIYQRANQKFQGRIDDDVALHFIGVIQKELGSLVIYDKYQDQSRETKRSFDKFKTKTLLTDFKHAPQNQVNFYKNWIFYFEPRTKNLIYMEVKTMKQLIKIELEIDFLITSGSRSIMGADNNIYYISGFDDNSNDDLNRTIYQYDSPGRTLIPKAKMYTLRRHFSLALQDKQIFIVGGQNYKEGCLTKCEKYDIDSSNISIINHLTEQSAYHTTCLFNQDSIIKFGGLKINIESRQQREICKEQLELYNIDKDKWTQVTFPAGTKSPFSTILSGAIQLKDSNQIYIFGGQMVLNKALQSVNQGFKIIIEEEEEFDISEQICKKNYIIFFQTASSLNFFYELNHQINVDGIVITNPIYLNNEIHCLIQTNDIQHCVFSNNKWS